MNKHDNNREYNPMSLATSVTQQYYQMLPVNLKFLDKILGNIISDHSRSPRGGEQFCFPCTQVTLGEFLAGKTFHHDTPRNTSFLTRSNIQMFHWAVAYI